MRLGIDATCITTVPEEGKDQVIYNLLRGWHALGFGSQLVIYCYSFMEERLRQMVPDGELRVFRRVGVGKKLLQDIPLRTFLLPNAVREAGLDVLLFPKMATGLGRFSIPSVVIPHDIQCRVFPRNYSKSMLIRELLFYAIDFRMRDRIVAISDFDAREICRYYPHHASKVVRIFNPVHFAQHDATTGGSPHLRPYLISVNFRYPHKNTITLLHAFDAVRDRIPHDLLLVGKVHTSSQHIIDFVQQRHLGDRVSFTGYVDEAHLHRMMRWADLYINTSIYEGFGMAPVEAMGAGTPVLTTRDAAIFETTRGLAEYYEPSTDPKALAVQLLRVLNNLPSLEERRRTENVIRTLYDYRTIAAEYWKLFSSLVGTAECRQPA